MTTTQDTTYEAALKAISTTYVSEEVSHEGGVFIYHVRDAETKELMSVQIFSQLDQTTRTYYTKEGARLETIFKAFDELSRAVNQAGT